MNKQNFRAVLAGFKFAANAKVSKGLKNVKTTDAELAAAVKTTKAYVDSKELQAEVAVVLAVAIEKVAPAPEPAKSTSFKNGEHR